MIRRLKSWLRRSGWSLGRRVAFTATLAALICLAIGGVALDWAVSAALRRETEAALGAAGSALLARTHRGVDGGWVFDGVPDFPRSARPDAWELCRPDGRTLAGSAHRAGRSSMTASHSRRADRPHAVWADIDGEPMLLMCWQKGTDGPLVAVARECEDSEEMQDAFRLILVAVGAFMAIAITVAILVSVGRGLRPLRDLGTQIAALDDAHLGQRIVLPLAPVDIQPVVERLNELMARLSVAFTRERSFAADVAHELRNPLGAIRLELESALAALPADAATRRLVANAHQACLHLQGLVERLLALVRLESGEVTGTVVETDIVHLLADTWSERVTDAARRGITAQITADRAIIIGTDPERLRAVLRNLIDNAIEHPARGALVTAGVEQPSPDRVLICISNTGCALAPDATVHVGERLWRGDPGRGGTGQHHGLGLALCRRLVLSLGGTMDITIAEGRFTVRIGLSCRPVPA